MHSLDAPPGVTYRDAKRRWEDGMQGEVLMERTTAGLTVELAYYSSGDRPVVFIVASTEESVRMAEVPADEAINAFHHPCAYFADPSVFA